MALNLASKVALGVIGTGIAGSVGVGGYFYATTPYPSVKQLLVSENPAKTALNLSTTDRSGWVSQWTSYVDNTEENIWELERWTEIKQNKSAVPDEFAKECTERIQEKVIDKKDAKYVDFLKWCTKQ